MDDIPHVEIYTDGGCDPNPGPGGWGAVIRHAGREWRLSGNDPATTNNRMELQAAAAALSLLQGLLGPCRVDLYTDSRYLQEGITRYVPLWERNDWLTRDGRPVKNRALWRTLHRLAQMHRVTWHWLRGHDGHPLNELADRLATAARQRLAQEPAAESPTQDAEDSLPTALVYVKASGRGASGWGAVLRDGLQVRPLSGTAAPATVNALLIRGATEALRALDGRHRVILHSDAGYLVNGGARWAAAWQARGWLTKDGRPVANRELWEELLAEARRHRVTWVRGPGDAPTGPDDLALAGKLAARR